LYMRTLRAHETQQGSVLTPAVIPTQPKQSAELAAKPGKSWKTFLKLTSLVLVTMSLSAGVSGTIAFKVLQTASEKNKAEVANIETAPQVLGANYEVQPAGQDQQPKDEDQVCNFALEDETKGFKALLILGESQKADVYCLPSRQSVKIITFVSPEKVEKLGEVGQWAFISFNQNRASGAAQRGWVKREHVIVTSARDSKPRGEEEEIDLGALEGKQVSIINTPTGYLNVREKPWGEENGQVEPGESFPYIEEQNGWVKIQLLDGSFGWVAKRFTQTVD